MIRNKNPFVTILLLSFTLLMLACGNSTTESGNDNDIAEDNDPIQEDENPVLSENQDSIRIIFYDLTSPVELTAFVKYSNTSFDESLLNPSENKTRYNINLKYALNMGVFGTDMIYCRSFNMKQESLNYLAAIKSVTKELGIPEEEVSETLGRADEHIDNKDSIFNIIQEAYLNADGYLNENDRKSTAALIYFGAWTESVYLAMNLYYKDGSNKTEIERHVAGQKFAINNLMTLLRNTYDNEDIYHYIVMIEHLKRVYDQIDILAHQDITMIDTANKTVVLDETQPEITEAQMEEIHKIIRRIRKDIVS